MTDTTLDTRAVPLPRMLHKWHDRVIVETHDELVNQLAEGYTLSHAHTAAQIEAAIAEEEQLGLRPRRSDAARQADWAVGQVEELAADAAAGDTRELDALLGLALTELLAHIAALESVEALLALRAREAAGEGRKKVLKAIDARLSELEP